VRRLEREGLIARSEHETHGRMLRIQLTPAGRSRLRQCKRLADEVERKLLELIDPGAEPKLRRWLSDVAAELIRE
jgi:DNA-binding MarR family transcriptional regulator